MKKTSLSFLILFLVTNWHQIQAKETCKNGYAGDENESFASGANDIIVVKQSDGTLLSTNVTVQVGKFTNWRTVIHSREGREMKIYINGRQVPTNAKLIVRDSGNACFARRNSVTNRYKLSDTEWANADLQPGLNPGYFSVDSLSIRIPFNVFLFEQDARFVLTDVDGTITETDVKGHVFPMFGFTAHHEHVVELFHKIADNGYQIVYLTARSIAQDVDTREYLFEDLQDQNGYSLPPGPVFMSPKTFAEALVDALSNPSPVKTSTIKSFIELFDLKDNVIKGAYGNRNSDTQAYMDAGIPTNLIYLVNDKSVLRRVDDGQRTSYAEHANNVNEMYPKN